jgi:hypothetical protein
MKNKGKNSESLMALPAAAGNWVSYCMVLALVLALPITAQGGLVLGLTEEAVEAMVQKSVEEEVEEEIEDAVEDAVEETVENEVEKNVEESVAAAVEEKIEEQVEERVLSLGDGGVQKIIDDFVERQAEEQVEDMIEESVEEEIASTVEETVEESVEETVEETVEEKVAEEIEEKIEETVEEEIASTVEETVEQQVAENVEEALEETVEEQVAANVEENIEQGVEASVETNVEEVVASNVEERLESEIDEILERIEGEFEIDERLIQKGQWLVMAEPEVFNELADEGYLFDSVTDLPGLGLRLAEVAAPSSFSISDVRQGVMDVVGSDRAEVDLNHFYTAGDPQSVDVEDGIEPRRAIDFPEDVDQMALRIGMIDSKVDVSHPSLSNTQIKSRSFASRGADQPEFHGTAIASILAANAADYTGLAPKAEVYAASVFEQHDDRGETASTVSLVRALDWLMSSGVDVVNISLAGPPNRLLEAALKQAAQSDVIILAAAGNGGPVAQPMYPAAYESVVAVTAVDDGGQVFRLANRGEYLDLAAPGVRMLHARAGGGYTASSGTSFAVPFAATAAARLRHLQPGQDVLSILIESAQDLGPPGRDEIYGYGLLRPAKPILTSGI